jgi:hypothetical protein
LSLPTLHVNKYSIRLATETWRRLKIGLFLGELNGEMVGSDVKGKEGRNDDMQSISSKRCFTDQEHASEDCLSYPTLSRYSLGR